MPKSYQVSIKSSLFNKEKLLTIEPDFVEFGNRFGKQEIDAIRYGVRGIRGYQFYFGRIYYIDIKSNAGNVIKIRFRSFYKIKRQLLYEQYKKIIQLLFENFINDISREYIGKFSTKEEFELLGIKFAEDGLVLKAEWGVIPWLDINTKAYTTYYTIYSMTEPTKYRAFTYLNDWNTGVLYSVSREILKTKGLWKETKH